MRFACVAGLLVASAAQAHFVFIVPQPGATKIKVVLSEDLSADEQVGVERLADTKLFLRGSDGKDAPLATETGKHELTAALPGAGVVHGAVDYGVMARGNAKPYMLRYLPKAIVGPGEGRTGAALEFVPAGSPGKARFLLLADGKPAAKVEVNVVAPASEAKKVVTDAEGLTPEFAAPGRYGLWAKVAAPTAGEFMGQKYEESRNYATLVVDVPAAGAETKAVAAKGPAWPAIPVAVSSLGAATCGDHVYLFGGHATKTHTYALETTNGKLHRLSLKDPAKGWEELAEGPRCQGLALVAHDGKVIRIGGMQPRNKAGEPVDQISLASVSSYDPATGKWSPLPDLPAPRSSHDACMIGDLLVVAGGWNMKGKDQESEWSETALVMDLGKQPLAWKSVPQPFRRRALNLGALDGKAYVVGGLSADEETEVSVNAFDPKTGTWTKAPPLPGAGRNGFSPAVTSLGGKLLANPADGNLYSLSAGAKAWETVGKVEKSRIVHRLAPHGDGVLVLGGAAKGGNVTAVEFVKPQSAAKPPVAQAERR
ncbi:MAG TPA: hypothetical protein VNC50_12295 [Planctomycetia bacterium]|nr:hypothetical protein [Planctomycetia bacterium]